MIPDFIDDQNLLWPILPPGIWDADIEEVKTRFALNPKRLMLFEGLYRGAKNLFQAGCLEIFLDGSYVTAKPIPSDYEVCWNAEFVDADQIDYVFFDFSLDRYNQKKKYHGEYFPDFQTERKSGMPFLEFFQYDKPSGSRKGIIRIKNFLKDGRQNDN
ncbi:hypothetical protein HDC90_004307 [Pedobacter sp. AK013]|uniref:DUF6932 family protein n=1 Tax=Pedobacter sp. AK013 TaxID=2723071 RepID=UPI0016129D7A|nr:hypothetical protein [Pedobacter sp. AK013]MBB6239649.1 hypothetical protein [Pedobacter sp. AK013]